MTKDEVKKRSEDRGIVIPKESVTVYEALYNNDPESAMWTISIHWTKEGAENAIKAYNEQELALWKKLYPTKEDEPYDFMCFREWEIRETGVEI